MKWLRPRSGVRAIVSQVRDSLGRPLRCRALPSEMFKLQSTDQTSVVSISASPSFNHCRLGRGGSRPGNKDTINNGQAANSGVRTLRNADFSATITHIQIVCPA